MSSTDPVSSITNCYRLIVSYTDPVHSLIISQRTVEQIWSSFVFVFGISYLVCGGCCRSTCQQVLGRATALACPDTFVFVFVFVLSQYYVFVFDTWYVVVVAGAVYTCQQVVGRATRTLPFFFLVPIFGRASSRAPDRLTSFKLPLQRVLTFLPNSIFLLFSIFFRHRSLDAFHAVVTLSHTFYPFRRGLVKVLSMPMSTSISCWKCPLSMSTSVSTSTYILLSMSMSVSGCLSTWIEL